MEPHEEFLRFSRPSLALDEGEKERADRHVEVLTKLLELRAEEFVLAHADEPIMEQFFSDGTPYSTVERNTMNWENIIVRRGGRE